MRVSSRAAKEATLKEVRLEVANKPWLWSLLPEWLKLFTSSPEYQPQASNPFLGSRLASGGPRSLQKVSRRRKARIPAGAPAVMVPAPVAMVPASAAMVPAPVPAPAAMVPTPVAVPAAMVPCSSAGPHSHGTVLQYHPTQPWFRVPVPCPAAMVPAPEPAHTAMVPAPVPCPAAMVPTPVPAPAAMSPLESPLEFPLQSPLEFPRQSPLESPLEFPLKSPLESLLQFPLKFLLQSPLESPLKSPLESLLQSPLEFPLKSPLEFPLKSPLDSPSVELTLLFSVSLSLSALRLAVRPAFSDEVFFSSLLFLLMPRPLGSSLGLPKTLVSTGPSSSSPSSISDASEMSSTTPGLRHFFPPPLLPWRLYYSPRVFSSLLPPFLVLLPVFLLVFVFLLVCLFLLFLLSLRPKPALPGIVSRLATLEALKLRALSEDVTGLDTQPADRNLAIVQNSKDHYLKPVSFPSSPSVELTLLFSVTLSLSALRLAARPAFSDEVFFSSLLFLLMPRPLGSSLGLPKTLVSTGPSSSSPSSISDASEMSSTTPGLRHFFPPPLLPSAPLLLPSVPPLLCLALLLAPSSPPTAPPSLGPSSSSLTSSKGLFFTPSAPSSSFSPSSSLSSSSSLSASSSSSSSLSAPNLHSLA
ncbi:hypothetical protein F7725_018968 [Dissostichus mawsoni]|uniref:Uncharacterized protein n=1 Tax=Dissostichus mawsoni TaxID=36200 RepID=A0A7J5XTP2_DISMA|nr:hypothetical protein F7725_018968 [Dissostichus mawsoni]